MNVPTLSYDTEADVLYVEFSDALVDRTVAMGDLRMVDYGKDGAVLGVEFVSASSGVDLDGVPFAQAIERAIRDGGLSIPVLV